MNTGRARDLRHGQATRKCPSHFGLLHGKNLTPHRAIWTLAILSIFIGIVTVSIYLGGHHGPAPLDKHNIWYSFGIFTPHAYARLPNTLLIITLISNFGTFLLYMTTCIVAIVAFREHHMFNGFKHLVVPVFGLLANLGLHAVLPDRAVHGGRHELAWYPTSRSASPPSGASTAWSTSRVAAPSWAAKSC